MGPSRGTCTDVEVRKLKRGEVAQWNDTARCRRGVGRADGRDVVMGCDEPLARGGGVWRGVGPVWFGAHRLCRRAFRDTRVCCGWAGGRRSLSHACHMWCETWWDAGGYVETVSAGRREGRDWDG